MPTNIQLNSSGSKQYRMKSTVTGRFPIDRSVILWLGRASPDECSKENSEVQTSFGWSFLCSLYLSIKLAIPATVPIVPVTAPQIAKV